MSRYPGRRWLALILVMVSLLALVAAACGEATDVEPQGQTATEAPASSTDATDATPASETPAATASATERADNDSDAAGTRSVETAFGTIEIPANPQRIVTIGDTPLDVAVSLGFSPVGATSSRGATGVAAYMAEHVGDIQIIGTIAEPNLESIVQLEPDLILTETTLQEAMYENLSKIAPTLVPIIPEGANRYDPMVLTRAYAQALGMTDRADELADELEARIAEVREKVGDRSGQTAVVIRWMAQGPMVMNGHLVTGQMLSEIGFTLPELAYEIEGGHSDVLSLENLAEIDTDWIFIATLNQDGQQALEAARQQPAFERLKANQANQVVTVNGQLWSSANGPLAATAILADIEQALAQ